MKMWTSREEDALANMRVSERKKAAQLLKLTMMFNGRGALMCSTTFGKTAML